MKPTANPNPNNALAVHNPTKTVGLIAKITRLCNLRCTYCHDWREGPNQTMSFPVLTKMISSALGEYDFVDFIWHGGETTVVPMNLYKKAMALQSRFRKSNTQHIRNLIQTNATRLDDNWVHFFKVNRFGVGVSIDGPPEIHDRYRRFAGGQASFDKVLRGIELLRKYEVPFSVLMVVNDETLKLGADRVFDFCLEHGIMRYSCLPANPANIPNARPNTPTINYADPTRIDVFLMRLYDRWLEHGDPRIRIRELASLEERIRDEPPSFCKVAGGCLGKYFLVEPDGDIAHCDLFIGDDRYTLGNIMRSSFSEITANKRMMQLIKENDVEQAKMRKGCPEFLVCNGGCPHERYLSVRHNSSHRDDCCGHQDLIAHIRRRLCEAPQVISSAVTK